MQTYNLIHARRRRPCRTGSVLGLLVAVFIAGAEIRVRADDRLLGERFGSTFADYRARARAYIPLIH